MLQKSQKKSCSRGNHRFSKNKIFSEPMKKREVVFYKVCDGNSLIIRHKHTLIPLKPEDVIKV